MSDENTQGSGGGGRLSSIDFKSNADLVLLEKAINHGWILNPDDKKYALDKLLACLESPEDQRTFARLMGCLVAINGQNIELMKLAAKMREKQDGVGAPVDAVAGESLSSLTEEELVKFESILATLCQPGAGPVAGGQG